MCIYKYHSENLRELARAVNLVQTNIRDSIRRNQDSDEYAYTKILSHLITCWAEVRILKLSYERGVTSNETQEIISEGNLKDRWIKALNISICKSYSITRWDNPNFIKKHLSTTARFRYESLIKLIEDDLLPSIELRNRVAHGQWKYAFTNDLKGFSEDLTGKLRTDNIVNLQRKFAIFTNLGLLIHDLMLSTPTFERDFDKYFKKIEIQKNNLHNRSYCAYKKTLIYSRQRGITKRKSFN